MDWTNEETRLLMETWDNTHSGAVVAVATRAVELVAARNAERVAEACRIQAEYHRSMARACGQREERQCRPTRAG